MFYNKSIISALEFGQNSPELSYRFIMLEFVVCHHINNRFNTGKLEVYDKILQLYVKALPLKSLCVPADFILPFISTMFRHRSPSSSAPCAASLTLAHISPFISRPFLTEQHKQHDEHVQRDG